MPGPMNPTDLLAALQGLLSGGMGGPMGASQRSIPAQFGVPQPEDETPEERIRRIFGGGPVSDPLTQLRAMFGGTPQIAGDDPNDPLGQLARLGLSRPPDYGGYMWHGQFRPWGSRTMQRQPQKLPQFSARPPQPPRPPMAPVAPFGTGGIKPYLTAARPVGGRDGFISEETGETLRGGGGGLPALLARGR